MNGSEIGSRTRRGRGAVSNRAGRFEPTTREAFDDGWTPDVPLPLKTEISIDRSRSVISRVASPDLPFTRSINPYRGCEHGCVYCFARPTHAYLGLSPGLDFETKLTVKPRAPELLRRALSRPRYRPEPIAIGTNTDPYQPIEKTHRVMRGLLEVLSEFNHPVTIVTKSAMVARDVDLLGPMGRRGLARVSLSLTSLDAGLSRKMEPRAATPDRRLWAMRQLAAAGCPVGVMTAPLIPAINDQQIEALLRAAAASGATSAGYVVLRLPLEVRDLFVEWLEAHFPDRAARVMRYVREIHGGRDYDPEWGKRLKGEGVYADLIGRRFRRAAAAHGLDRPVKPLRTDLFTPPAAIPVAPQLSFLDRLDS
ncbi:PA0069 family radical SAM protein [Pikeienuella piscinae]|uniref:PA0069 family radical SAM protein n=1 Tax=Pikeienuella piscinae TaxID=2748098 RepID=A0A7L5C0S6_9RHOB|nr:PA0069 family radical SAM protein [Pikeienuella piscinae]QIE56116.1 PA0069 family radical SAM protein [Pikeienuella piscinae]